MLRLFGFLLLAPSVALAAEFPVSQSYGTPYGCETLKSGEDTASPRYDDNWLLVTKTEISGHEFACTAGTPLGGGRYKISCNEAGDEGAGTESWAILIEDKPAQVLNYRDQDGPMALHACQ